jgi:hypothetical protein
MGNFIWKSYWFYLTYLEHREILINLKNILNLNKNLFLSKKLSLYKKLLNYIKNKFILLYSVFDQKNN